MPLPDEIERLLAEMSAVWRLAVHLCEVRHAESLVQETYLRVFKDLASPPLADDRAARLHLFKALHTIAVEIEEKKLSTVALGDDAALPQAAGDTQTSELAAQLQAAVCELPLPHRAVFLLSVVEKLRYSEIATVVGESVEVVTARLNDASLSLAARVNWNKSSLPPSDREQT